MGIGVCEIEWEDKTRTQRQGFDRETGMRKIESILYTAYVDAFYRIDHVNVLM